MTRSRSPRPSPAPRGAGLDIPYELFFRRTRETLPQAGIPQNALDRVRADQGHPALRFGQFVGETPFAPLWVGGPRGDDLPLHRRGGPGGMVRRAAGILLQGRIALRLKAALPIVEGAAPHMGARARRLHIARCLPRFKQQAALRGRRAAKVYPSAHRCPPPQDALATLGYSACTNALPLYSACHSALFSATCSCPKQDMQKPPEFAKKTRTALIAYGGKDGWRSWASSAAR